MGHLHRFASATPPAILAVGLLALSLGGCGRRGPLELPAASAPTSQASAATEARQDRILNDGDTPGLIQSPNQFIENTPITDAQRLAARASSPVAPRPINAPPVPPRGTFFLDPLL